jgi:threonine dehydrogenase-like Zn-dependent dehydrogenase
MVALLQCDDSCLSLIQLICDRKIDPGKVFDLTLPLEEAPAGYKAMDQRRAIEVMLTL